MVIENLVLIGVLGICSLAVILSVGPRWLYDWIQGDRGHTRRYDHFIRTAMASGMTYSEAQDELFLREQFAKLRREASDAVLANPQNWNAILGKAKEDAFGYVMAHRPDLAPAFAKMITGISYGHIFYPDACYLAEATMTLNDVLDVSQDQFAALKIVPPS